MSYEYKVVVAVTLKGLEKELNKMASSGLAGCGSSPYEFACYGA